jgi:hypothetical protein
MAFIKGQSGNPGGRSTEKIWRDAVGKAIKQRDASGKQKIELLAEKLVACALNGESWAVLEVGNRLDGKPAQAIDMTYRKTVTDLTDAELAAIAAGGSEGAAEETAGPEKLPSVH